MNAIEKEFGRFIAAYQIAGDLDRDPVCSIGNLHWYGHRGVADRIWRQSKFMESLQYVSFDLASGQFNWRSSFHIAPGIFVDRAGKAAEVEEACRLAVECERPDYSTFDYLGQKTDWYWTQNPGNCWTSAIEGERGHIIELRSNKFFSRRDRPRINQHRWRAFRRGSGNAHRRHARGNRCPAKLQASVRRAYRTLAG